MACAAGAPALTRRALGALLLASLAAACSKQTPRKEEASSAPKRTSVKLALNWVPEPEFGGFYAARDGQHYAQRGLDVEIQSGGAGFPVLQMVATGRTDFGTVGADELVTGKVRGTDVVAVFATFQSNPQAIMAHASRKLQSLEQVFRSGTLAIESGLAYAAFLKQKFGWEGAKIVPYDGGVARFLADPNFAQQCYATSEPLAAKRQGADPQVFLIADTGFNPYATVVVTRRALLREKPDLVRSFVEATREGWKSYLADPRATNGLLGKLNPAMDAVSLADAAEAQKPLIEGKDGAGLGHMTRERWAALVDQLLSIKLIDSKPNVDELFTNPS